MDIDAAVNLYAEFRKQANRAPNKPLSQKILDSRLVLAKGVSLDRLSQKKLLACAPFDRTVVSFTTEPIYKNQPFSQSAGFRFGALLYDEPEDTMHLFAVTRGNVISLIPREMTEPIQEGLKNFLVPIWAHLSEKGNPTKDWWGKQQHIYAREQDEVPPDYYVPGMFVTQGSAADKGLELARWARDTRASIKLRVERGTEVLEEDQRERLTRLDYQLWDIGEAMDAQPENLLLKRGHRAKRSTEWLAAKMWRSNAYVSGEESGSYIPSARVSTI